jgi:hypothetical protein
MKLHISSNCTQLEIMAEQELTALFHAVQELYGSEQANLIARDWLDDIAAMSSLPASTREWRQITVKTLAQLATRVSPQHTLEKYLQPETASVYLSR